MLKRNLFLLSLFSVGFTKTLFLPSSFVDVSVLLIVGAVLCYSEYKNQDKRWVQIEQALKMHKEEIGVLQDKISSIKIIQQSKPNSLGFRQ
jgi:hypothetical protein